MEILKIILSSFVGTTVMTAFSYYISEKFNMLFKEPVLLHYLLLMWNVKLSTNSERIASWGIHYSIGVLFVVIYNWIWNSDLMELTWLSGLVLGMASGIIGIIGWMLMFSVTSVTPKIHFKEYYVQLFLAHIIFGFGVVATYKLYYS